MNLLLVALIIATGVALCAGVVATLRGFNAGASETPEPQPDAHPQTNHAHPAISPHNRTVTDQLKRFFEGKECALCKRPIPPVHRGLKPGLWNPQTHQSHSWDEIPNENLSATLENELPVCSDCQIAESFRERYPDLVVDRERARKDAQPPDRIVTS